LIQSQIKITFDNNMVPYQDPPSYLTSSNVHMLWHVVWTSTFHIFYKLLAAFSQLKKQYRLTECRDYNYLTTSGTNFIADGIDDVKEFEATQTAMNVLGFTKEEQDMIFRVVSAILHIGNVKFQ